MRTIRVPFSVRPEQIPLALITLFSCGLSFWLTVRFCADLAPGHATGELLAIGVTWELAKLAFGSIGGQRIKSRLLAQRRVGYGLVAVSLVLAVGSTGASLAFLVQTDGHLVQEKLHASGAYQRDSASLRALDSDIQSLSTLAAQDTAQGFRTRGLRTLERVAELRQQRQQWADALSARESAVGPRAGGAASVVGAWAAPARLGAQCVLAVMLEVVSMIALSLLCGSGAASRQAPSAGPAALSDPRQRTIGLLSIVAPHARRDAAAGPEPAHATRAQERDGRGRPLLDVPGADSTESHLEVRCASSVRLASRTRCRLPVTSGCASHAAHGPSRDVARLYAVGRDLVATAQVRPSYRSLRRALGVSQKAVQQLLAAMLEEGLLCRVGKGFALVGQGRGAA